MRTVGIMIIIQLHVHCIHSFTPCFQLPIGRESIGHYRVMRRNPVFSHDELVCKLIMKPDQLELCLLNSTAEDAKRMVKEECMIRDTLTEKVLCVIACSSCSVTCVYMNGQWVIPLSF